MALKCVECGLQIHPGQYKQLQPEITKQTNILCTLGLHKYDYVVSLYENHDPIGVAIFRVCTRCGKGIEGPIAFKAVYSVTRRLDRIS